MIYRVKSFKPFWISILFFLVVLKTGCDKTNLLDEYYLGDLIYTIPYQGAEVLVFSSSEGMDLSFPGNGRFRESKKNYLSVNSNEYYITEVDYCSFIDSINNYSIFFSMKTYRNDPPKLWLGFSNNYLDKTNEFNANSMFILPLSFNNLQSGQEYFDSIAVGSRYYYHVFSDSCEVYFPSGDNSDTSQYLSKLFYNIDVGLIKLNFSDGIVWELKKIIQ
ncbi:MAG: hypothetical protein K8R63_02480 [Bacteroidales bacterium]|nr:hypothetical protein [Bacteroidales bacterium]